MGRRIIAARDDSPGRTSPADTEAEAFESKRDGDSGNPKGSRPRPRPVSQFEATPASSVLDAKAPTPHAARESGERERWTAAIADEGSGRVASSDCHERSMRTTETA